MVLLNLISVVSCVVRLLSIRALPMLCSRDFLTERSGADPEAFMISYLHIGIVEQGQERASGDDMNRTRERSSLESGWRGSRGSLYQYQPEVLS